jgi:hypothetical protein
MTIRTGFSGQPERQSVSDFDRNQGMQIRQFAILILVALMAVGCGAVNRNIQIADGERVEGDVRNVNGSIRIGSNCTIIGGVRNVNGAIFVGAGTRLEELRNTNGAIELDADVLVTSVRSTNGRIRAGQGVTVAEDVSNTNGAIELAEGVTVGGDVQTTNGRLRIAEGGQIAGTVRSTNGPIVLTGTRAGAVVGANGGIELIDGTHIEGEVHVRETRGTVTSEPPRIIVGRDVVVEGPIRIERPVQLYIHESARTGDISGAEAIRFSGEQP